MSAKLRSIHQSAPVTALAVLPASSPVLLAGIASTLLALTLAQQPSKIQQWQALERDRIHAIVAVPEDDAQPCPSRWLALVLGGREAALVRIQQNNHKLLTVERLWLIQTADWVHAGAFISRNGFTFITAHNSITHYKLSTASPYTPPTLVHTYHCPLRPLLWTASFSRPSYSSLSEVSAGAGSMIGEAFVFNLASVNSSTSSSSSSSTETTLPISSVVCLRGHHTNASTAYRNFVGGVFCLAFAADGKRVITGSDDRTIRVWNLPQNEEECDRQEDGSRVIGPVKTLYAHEGRVWRLSWLDERTIASVAEDTTCKVWSLEEAAQANPVIKTFKDGHDGRSIWALASCRVGEVRVVLTGGADGAIRSWALHEQPKQEDIDNEGGRFLALDVGSPIRSFHAAELTGEGQVGLLVTKLGALYSTQLPPSAAHPPKLLFKSAALRTPCLLSITPTRVLLVSNNGLVLTIDRSTSEARQAETGVAAVEWDISEDERRVALYERRGARVVVLDLGAFLVGVGDPRVFGELELPERKMLLRAMKLSPDGELLLLGAVSGAILLCSAAGALLARTDTAHSKTVSQFDFLESLPEGRGWDVESVSRDGTVCVHRIERSPESGYTLRTTKSETITQGEVSQILAPIAPGGVKRYLSLVETSALVIDASGSMLHEFVSPGSYDPYLVCSARGIDLYRTLGGKVHHQFAPAAAPAPPGILRPRFHGREVRSIALESFETPSGASAELMITGAENAVLRVSRVDKDGGLTSLWEDPQPVAAIKSVAVSSHFKTGPHFLFASGAREHLRAFKLELNDAPLAGSTEVEVRARVWPAGTGPTVTDSGGEVRVMDMWVGPLDEASRTHWCVTGYSDGFVRVWTYDERGAKFTRVAESGVHAKCLLSLKMVRIPGVGEDGWLLFSAASDGLVAVWDFTALRKQLVKGEAASPIALEDPILTYRAHLSGVNGLDAVYDPEDFSILLATAGDDNALALSRVHLSPAPRIEPLSRVPNAHSSTIQGLTFLPPAILVSSSVDQRMNVWRLFTHRADGVQVRDRAVMSLVEARELAVADCSAMSCLRRAGEAKWLVGVAGIGVELLELDLSGI